MDTFYAIELTNKDHHDIVEPFLEVVPSFVEHYSTFYIFSSLKDVHYIEEELSIYSIIEMTHTIIGLSEGKYWDTFEDYGLKTNTGKAYLLNSMVKSFQIIGGTEDNIKMALLQFDEHLIAQEHTTYFVDVHHQALIEKIANAYEVSIAFFELDK
ncbi:hypothetical protein [Bacillus suaedaesalsae]|uniref:Uncharacterized protein n=1 Tax=Bacillus suaedaesalsae TaxID=2810349 RepID=A0ABS2DFM1_9BACI|nr:hypothetical protein [Bacillus suaedaesalsae]MBM6617267.1 hypothetical protein [Bacillus suaedaesalsae]